MNNKTIQFKTCACCAQPIETHSLSHTEDGQVAHYDCIQKSEQEFEQYYEMLELMGY